MSDQGLALAQEKMTDAGVAQQAIDVFSHYYRQLEEGVTGFIAEDSHRAADRSGPAAPTSRSATPTPRPRWPRR